MATLTLECRSATLDSHPSSSVKYENQSITCQVPRTEIAAGKQRLKGNHNGGIKGHSWDGHIGR